MKRKGHLNPPNQPADHLDVHPSANRVTPPKVNFIPLPSVISRGRDRAVRLAAVGDLGVKGDGFQGCQPVTNSDHPTPTSSGARPPQTLKWKE